RLIQLSKTEKYLSVYITCVIFGVLFGTYLTLTPAPWNQSVVILLFFGGVHGIFNGMLAAALTEVLNVFPILFKRIGLDNFLLWLLAAIRSEEHTSELQSRFDLVCRLLLDKK